MDMYSSTSDREEPNCASISTLCGEEPSLDCNCVESESWFRSLWLPDIEQKSPSLRTMCGVDMGNYGYCFVGACEDDISVCDDELLDITHLHICRSQIDDVMQIKHLFGRKLSEPELQSELRFPVTEGSDGLALVPYRPLDMSLFSPDLVNPTQLVSMWLSDRRAEMVNRLSNIVSDCCIGIPIHFTCEQRREVLHAATIARLTPRRLLHETTAAALAYRFSCADLPRDCANMAFIDVGHSSMQVSVIELKKEQLKVLSHAYDKSLGVSGFDQVLIKHYSTNAISANVCMKRTKFEKLNSKLLNRVRVLLRRALSEANLSVDDVHSVEVTRLGSSLSAILNILKDFFKKEPRQTMKKREPIAAGCFIDCAVLCLASKLPKFQIIDILPYSIGLSYESHDDKTQKQVVVFPKGCPIPSVKDVLFLQTGRFLLDLVSINADDAQGSSKFGTFMIGTTEARGGEQLVKVNVRVRLSLHGISFIESATVEKTFVPVVELSRDRILAGHFQNDEQWELETTLRDKVQKVERELEDVSMQLKNSLNVETERRIEVEKSLEKERISGNEHKSTLERELTESKALIDTIRKQQEEWQFERENAIKERDNALKKVLVLRQTKEEQSSSRAVNITEFSYSELQEATNNFDKSLEIGKGGYGSVYKGFLRYTTVAIKKLNPKGSQGNAEFNQEVEILSKVRHPNLVSLIGASPEALALIYEFLPNGSLDTFLTNGESSPQKLSWQNRIRITSEICSALIFLHSLEPHGIAHGDLKPGNILLDLNFVSKLTDFGISRELYLTDDTVTPLHSTENPKFTGPYCDPEFFSSYELTPQCDVYSFGIIMLQLVTGRDPQKIKDLVEEALATGELDTIVDGSAGEWPIEEAEKLASLGLRCSDPSRRKRPDLAKDVWPSIESMKRVAGLHIVEEVLWEHTGNRYEVWLNDAGKNILPFRVDERSKQLFFIILLSLILFGLFDFSNWISFRQGHT